jgi:hypothetical protein
MKKAPTLGKHKFMVMASNPLPIKKDQPSREMFFQHEWVATRPFQNFQFSGFQILAKFSKILAIFFRIYNFKNSKIIPKCF